MRKNFVLRKQIKTIRIFVMFYRIETLGGANVSVSFLIVCEGERTEPNYFKALIKDRYTDIREVTIEGKGQGTVSFIKETIAIRDKSNKEFDRVWAVFDKDDFKDAIKLTTKNNILCA